MISRLRVFIITLITLVQFVGTVILELIAAFAVYLALWQLDPNYFGGLVSLSREVLNLFSTSLERFFPAAATQANATLLGELSPKAVLLLLIGLTVGAILRFTFWGIKCAIRRDVSIG